MNMVGVDIDMHGILPEKLSEILTNWESLHPGKKMPKVSGISVSV